MKPYVVCSVIILGTAPLTVFAEAFSGQDITFQPRAYAGYADYSLDSSNFNKTIDGTPSNAPLNMDFYNHHNIQFSGFLYGVGGTLGYGRFFGDLYYQSTLNETVYSSEERYQDKQILYYSDVNAQHADWALSAGYMITDQWSVFAGYKSGKTKWDQSSQINSMPDSKLLNQQGNLNVEFEQDGPFLGTSYSFLIGPGALTFKAAYAYLNGTYKWNLSTVEYGNTVPVFPVSYLQFINLDGNSNAYSFGVSWMQSVTGNLGISIGANYHWYKFNMSGTGSVMGQNPRPVELSGGSLTEDLFTLTASILYRF